MWYKFAKITVLEYYNQLNKIKSSITDEILQEYFDEKIKEIDVLPDKISDSIAKYIIRNNINILANLNCTENEENKDKIDKNRIDPVIFNNPSIESKKQYLDKIINDYKNKLITTLEQQEIKPTNKTINMSDVYKHATEIMNLCERLKRNPSIFNKYCSNIMTGQVLLNPLKLFDLVFTVDEINSINSNNIDKMYNEAIIKYNQDLMQKPNYNISRLLYYNDLNNIIYTFTEEPYKNWTIRRIPLGNHILEGYKMNHCVGKNHTENIGTMEYFYYSLRNENNWPIVTFHVNEYGRVIEMKAANNKEVVGEYNKLLDRFFKTPEWENETNSFKEKKQILSNMSYYISSVKEFKQFINSIQKYNKDNVLYTSLLYKAIKNMSLNVLENIVEELLKDKSVIQNITILTIIVSQLADDEIRNKNIIMKILEEYNILIDKDILKTFVLDYEMFELLVYKKYTLDEDIIEYLMDKNCYSHLLHLAEVNRSLDYYNLQLICKDILQYAEDRKTYDYYDDDEYDDDEYDDDEYDDDEYDDDEYNEYNYRDETTVYSFQFFKQFFSLYYAFASNVEYITPILISTQLFNSYKHLLTPDRLKKLTLDDIDMILTYVDDRKLLEQIFQEYSSFILKNYNAFLTLLRLTEKNQNFAPLLIENYKKYWSRLNEYENSKFIINVLISNKKELLRPIEIYYFDVLKKKINATSLKILHYNIYNFIQQYEKYIDNINDEVFALLLQHYNSIYVNEDNQKIEFIKQLYHKYKHNINMFPIAKAINSNTVKMLENEIEDHLQYKEKYSVDDVKNILMEVSDYVWKIENSSIMRFINFLEKYQNYMEINNEIVLMILEKCKKANILTRDLVSEIIQKFDKFIIKDEKFENELSYIIKYAL